MTKLHGKFRIPALFFCIAFFVLSICACTDISGNAHNLTAQRNEIHPDHKNIKSSHGLTEQLKPDPALVRGVLPNGLRYVFLKNKTPEKRVSLHLDVQTGSFNELETQRGLAHFMEHMVFNGSKHFKPGKLVEYFQSIGMSFGADANAHTGFFETVFDILLPQGNKKDLSDGLLVLDDYARGALLLNSEIDKERGVILSEKRDRDTVSFRTFKASLKFELPGSRIAQRIPIGLTKVIKTAHRQILKDYYDTWYRPENMVIVGVGDFDPLLAVSLVKKEFSDMKPRAPKRKIFHDNWKPYSGIHTFYHYEKEAPNTDITIERIIRKPFKQDSLDSFKKRSIISLAQSMLRSRLSRILKKKGSSFSDASSYSGTFLRNIGFSVITAEAEPGKWKQALCELENVLAQAIKFGFTEEELHRAKADYIMELDSAVKEASTRNSTALARAIIRQINRKRVFQSPEQKRDILKPFIRSLTIEDVNKAFDNIWADDQRLVLITGNAVIDSKTLLSTGTKDPEALILNLYKKCRLQKIEKYHEAKAIAFPYLPAPHRNGKIAHRKNISDLGISIIDFKNKVRLNLKRTDFKKDEFIFRVDIDGGRKVEPADKPGLAMMAASTINGSGFGQIDSDQLAAALSGKNVDISFHSGEGHFYISGSAGSDEIKLVFQLLRNYFLDPGFRHKTFDLVRERYQQMYKQLESTPQGMMQLKGEKFLAGGDTRFGLPQVEQIDKISLKDIKSWIKPYLNHGSIEVSVAGDFDPEKIISQASKYLGSLPERDDNIAHNERKSPEFPKGQNLSLTIDSATPKAIVELSFLTGDFWNIKQTRRMNILASIFSDRLRRQIREKLGESYSPYAYNDPSMAYPGYGVFHAAASVSPAITDTVEKEMENISMMLEKNGVTKKELRLALKPVLTHIKDIKRRNIYWLNSVLSGCRQHPEKIKWARQMEDDYAAISQNGIDHLAAKYFKRDNQALIIIKSR